MSESIFARVRLNATQLRTVADRRFDDAMYLWQSRRNKHANGVMYLGGFVLECLLKAKFLDRYPELARPRPQDHLDRTLAYRSRLMMQSHDLSALLAEIPEVIEHLRGLSAHGQLAHRMRSLCGQWSIFARYSPRMATMQEAGQFLLDIRELRPWLR